MSPTMFNAHAIWKVSLMLAIEQPSSVKDLKTKVSGAHVHVILRNGLTNVSKSANRCR